MKQEEKEIKRNEICEFRYGVIAELANPYIGHGILRNLIRDKARREYDIPYSKKSRITKACIRKWLCLYRKYGKDGLLPKVRKDSGVSRRFSDAETSLLLDYLEEHPLVTATAAYKLLKEEGKIQTDVSSSTLSRIIVSSGCGRENRINKYYSEKNLKFQFFSPLECVQADCMHGFPVADEKGIKRKAILIAFIDDATRRIVYADFSHREYSLAFEAGIKHILQAHGRMIRLYVDNGSTFVSKQTKRILSVLGILLSHSKPGRPQGRGKIERFFRTTRDCFIRPLDKDSIKTLGDLNTRYRSWLESEYHRNPHRGLSGKTPLETWLSKSKYIIPLDPGIDLDRVMLHEETRKVYKDSTITLHGTLYEVPYVLIGKTIKVYYNPHQQVKKLSVSYDGREYGDAKIVDTYANTKVRRSETIKGELNYNNKHANPGINAALSASKIELGGNIS